MIYPNPYWSPWGTGGGSSGAPSFPPETNDGNSGAAISLSQKISLAHKLTLTANCNISLSDLVAGAAQWGQIKVVQGGAGSFTATLVGAKTPSGTGLFLSTPVGAVDLVNWYWDGGVLYAQVVGLNFQ